MCECGITMCCDGQGFSDPDVFMCRLPANNEREANELLEIVGSGGALGTGARLSPLGVQIPRIRAEYEQAVRQFMGQFETKRASGMNARQLADWAVRERARIARRIRMRHGVGQTVLFEIRDWTKYGVGGRTPSNMRRRYGARGFRGADIDNALIRGSTQPNHPISATARNGARYLRHGGRVIIIVSVITTAYVLLTTPEDQLERVIYEEIGGFTGGWVGAGAGVGFCLVFGIATGGWGLLACGVVGGIGGGFAGSYAGNRIYYSRNSRVVRETESTGLIDPRLLDGGECR